MSPARGEHSYQEITTQTASWRGALHAIEARGEWAVASVRASADQRVLFVGCGSTHYLAQFAARAFQSITGRLCAAHPSSDLLLNADQCVAAGETPLVVALSRSGETSETIHAASAMRRRGSTAVCITCYGDSPLAGACDATVAIPDGREESFAQTRSFAGMLVAVQALAARVAGDDALLAELARLPSLGDDIISRTEVAAQRFGVDASINRITFLGSGALYGLANEATVKMKEMSLSIAEGYRFMEFRHGPMSLVDGEHLVVALLSTSYRPYELAVLSDLKARGARLLALGQGISDAEALADQVFELDPSLSKAASAVLYLPFLQYLAYHRAMSRGLNPDRPRNVVMAIKLDGTEMIE